MNHKTDMEASFDSYYAENWPLCKASIEKGTASEEIVGEREALWDVWQDAWKAALAGKSAGVAEPIYQTRWGRPETVWGDVEKAAYDDFESFGYAARRIVYAAAPAPVSDPEQPVEANVSIYVDCYECRECGHVGINDAHPTDAACGYPCGWSGPSPVEDKCPGCGKTNVMSSACPKCSGLYRMIAEAHIDSTSEQPSERVEQDCPHGVDDGACKQCYGEATRGEQGAALSNDARECLMDVVSHYANILAGFAAQRLNACEAGDSDSATYWTREMNVANRMKVQAERALAASAPTLAPVHGDVLPAIGEQVLIHLASADVWELHTVVGYYVWPDLRGDSFLQRVFVRVRHSDGTMNARMLRDVRRADGSHYVEPTVKLPAPQPQAAEPKGLTDEQREQLSFISRCDSSFLIRSVADNSNFDAKVLKRVFELAKDRARALLANGE